ncbi:iron-siderophore ABC transporter substrate-binding protein [Rhodococcus aetherivorans]|uniref:iron-siderophore ABC transporter substrate-binding protein n=1 Tax=Rhodococcus aetherivorans TaxID=191292 RepID=UPI0002D238B8|nr:iron-siderophore ABC transporter substrate-binding protein [Rhodococcus aetherivorans]CCW09856.1 iron ABC transporter, substrate binding protein [Rhodococcus aetherivorans]
MPSTRIPRLLAAAGLALTFVLTACSSGSDEAGESSSAAGGAFPVTIEHALGSTTLDGEPERVVTWGFGSTDAALALGVVPVAIPAQSYGGDAQGVLPWIGDRLAELGAETPAVLPNDGTDVPVEQIAAARPDVILANYSGLTREQYETLSRIAPTVAYPDEPWATPWRDVVATVGQALGRSGEAARLIADTEATIAEKVAAYPQLRGRTVAAVWDTGDTFYVYKPADSRVEFLTDLGLVSAPSVAELSTDESSFYFTLSFEEAGKLTSDILLSYADDAAAQERTLAQPWARTMGQVTDGRVAKVNGTELIAAVSPPTVLSLTWGIDAYLEALAAAAE